MFPDYLIIGLGNPGKKYKKTRHNVGFMVCDYIASFYNLDFRFGPGNSQVVNWDLNERRISLAKPLTFMNLSGQTVKVLLNAEKIELDHILVLTDDYNLPLGTIRIREAGSSGKHKGLQSIIDTVGTTQFARMRIGITGEKQVENSVDFVLNNFKRSELKIIRKLFPVCVEAIHSFIFEGIDKTMSKYNKNYDFTI